MMFVRVLLLAAMASAAFAEGYTNWYNWTIAAAPAGAWKGVSASATGQFLVITESGSGTSGTTIYSTDFGATWHKSAGGAFSTVSSDASGRYVFGSGGYVSEDFGKTFTKRAENAPNRIASDSKGKNLIGVTSSTSTVMLSHDGGYTWQAANFQSKGCAMTATDYSGQNLVSVSECWETETFSSSNYGETWTYQPTTIQFSGVVSSGDGKVIYATSAYSKNDPSIPSRVYKSTDAGKVFALTDFPMPTVVVDTGAVMATDSTGNTIAVQCDGIWVSRDAGKTTQMEVSTQTDFNGFAMSHSGDFIIAVPSNNSGVMIGRLKQ